MKTHLLCSFRYKKVRLGILKESASCFFALIFSLTVYTQEFAPYGAMWHYTMTDQGDTSYYTAKSVDSTIIDGEKCRVLEIDTNCKLSGKVIVYSNYSGDSIYWYEPNSDEFQLIFAFDAQPGERWSFAIRDEATDSLSHTDSVTVTVDSVDTANINGTLLPKLYVTYSPTYSNAYSGSAIKYVGDMLYLFNFYGVYKSCHLSPPGGLRCYEDNYLGFYETGIAPSCKHEQEYLSVETHDLHSPGMRIYPNPASNALNITLQGQTVNALTIYDLSGREVYKTALPETLPGGDFTFDVSSLPSGAYIVYVQTRKGEYKEKWIKNE